MHPTVTPRVITHFEPWMALSFSDGSIGPDFERVNLNQLEAFYSLRATAYDSYLPSLAEQIPALLRAWDFRWGATSIPTSLAVYWGEEIGRRTDGEAMLQALSAASDKLAGDFGTWKTPWGDTASSVSPATSSSRSTTRARASRSASPRRAGARSRHSARARRHEKIYGTTGNSFVAVVEFGDRVKARAGVGGGESGEKSPHFNDQAARYSTGPETHFTRSWRDTSSGSIIPAADACRRAAPAASEITKPRLLAPGFDTCTNGHGLHRSTMTMTNTR